MLIIELISLKMLGTIIGTMFIVGVTGYLGYLSLTTEEVDYKAKAKEDLIKIIAEERGVTVTEIKRQIKVDKLERKLRKLRKLNANK